MVDVAAMLPTRLREARLTRGMTLEAVADALNSSLTTIWRYEAGQRRPSGPTLYALAEVYGKPVEWFFGQDEPVAPPAQPPQPPDPIQELLNLVREMHRMLAERPPPP